MPSFLSSTLSLAFMLCVVAVLTMIFTHTTPDKDLLAVITWVVSAYLASRNPNSPTTATATTTADTTTISTDTVAPVITPTDIVQ